MQNTWSARERLEVPLHVGKWSYVARRTGHYGDGTFYFKAFSGYVINRSVARWPNTGEVYLTLQSSLDGINWTTVAEIANAGNPLLPGVAIPFAYTYNGDYVRLMAYSDNGGILALEHDIPEPFSPPYLYGDVLDGTGRDLDWLLSKLHHMVASIKPRHHMWVERKKCEASIGY